MAESVLALEIVSIASVIIAGAAVAVAYLAPIKAAKVGAKMALDQNRELRQEDLKRGIFVELIKSRRRPMNDFGVAALNLIDFVFLEDKSVRNSWSKLHDIYHSDSTFSEQQRALNDLISEIAKHLGISSEFGHADVNRWYVPNSVVEANDVIAMETKLRLIDLRAEYDRRLNSEASND